MAERSKALCSGSLLSIAVRKGVGSNPTLVTTFLLLLFVFSDSFFFLHFLSFFGNTSVSVAECLIKYAQAPKKGVVVLMHECSGLY